LDVFADVPAALQQALLAADSLRIHHASTGINF